MDAPSELHFGAVELTRLAVLQQTAAPDDLARIRAHWEGQPLGFYLKQLTLSTGALDGYRRFPEELRALREEFSAATHERELFVELFLGSAPFFARDLCENTDITAQEREQFERVCSEAVQQGIQQRTRQLTGKKQHWEKLYRTFCRSPGSAENITNSHSLRGRPFIHLMGDPRIAELLHHYMEYVALRMAKACRRNPKNSSPVVWLGYTEWKSLRFFDRARVVLAAKEYEQYICDVVHARQNGLGAIGVPARLHLAPSLGHQHAPSLTSRQARRSGVSQSALKRRWA